MLNKASVVTSVWVGSGSSRQQAITINNLDGGVINDQPGLTTSRPGRETLQHLHLCLEVQSQYLHRYLGWAAAFSQDTSLHVKFKG